MSYPRIIKDARKMLLCAAALSCATSLSACSFLDTFVPKAGETTDVIDRQQNLTVDDFRKLNDAKALKKTTSADGEVTSTVALGTPPVPDLSQVLAAPKVPKVANTKLVTISVTEDVPLRDVLFELGRLAQVDIEVGSGLDTTGINLRATDRPFNEVIERIAKMANLRYSVSGNSIRVERDTPYIKNYSLDFLNIVRSSSSTYNLSTNILSSSSSGSSSSGSSSSSSSSSGSSGSSGFGTTGSTNNITSQGESDLFSSLEASITEIINYQPAANGAAASTAAAAPVPALPGAAGAAATASGGSGAGGTSFVVNRQSNVLTVNASQAQHEMIERFLTLMSRNASAQVLIEAKVVEVSLADEFLSGVNWNQVLGGSPYAGPGQFSPPATTNVTGLPTVSSTLGSSQTSPTGAAIFGLKGGDLNAVLSMTQRFGTTRTLSSPRLSAINNQQAVITFARNEIYFNCTATPGAYTQGSTTGTPTQSQPTVSCSQQTVPLGVIMSVLPSINLNTQEVTLNVRPTLTRKVGTVDDPSTKISAKIAGLSASDVSSSVPVIEVRELDSVMKVKSGGIMVIGGLMEDTTRNATSGVPGAAEIPFIGNLFKSRSEDSTKRELIIFIKATIVNPDGGVHPIDKAVFEKYVTDPRSPFKQ